MQKIRGIPQDKIAAIAAQSTWGAEDTEHPDFQLGDGCLVDQLIGQYLADVAGSGRCWSRRISARRWRPSTTTTIARSLTEHDSVQRTYALNDEAALLICDYGKAERPRDSVSVLCRGVDGIEYLFASHLHIRRHGARGRGVLRRCPPALRRRAAQSLGRAGMRPSLCARHVGVVRRRWRSADSAITARIKA